jgi:hypothetical protein
LFSDNLDNDVVYRRPFPERMGKMKGKREPDGIYTDAVYVH